MRYLHRTLTVGIMGITLIQCQTEVDLPQLPYDDRVVIQGIIEVDSVPIIHLNRTIPYLTGSTDPKDIVIRNATVTIEQGGETDFLFLDSVFLPMDCQFLFFYKGSITAKANTTYTLNIITETNSFTATTTTSLTAVNIDSVSYTPEFKDIYGIHEGVITYFRDIANEENYYRFEMSRKADRSTRDVTGNNRDLLVPCLEEGDTITFREVGRSVYSDKNLQDKQVKIVIEPGLTHEVVVTIDVRIQTIDKATYDFYNQIDAQKLAQFNPFVEPVFLLPGQFGNDATGFFGSMIRSESVRFEMPLDD